MLPAFFVAHGSPTLVVEQDAYTRFLAELGAELKPRAVVIFSAHWLSGVQEISAVPRYHTIHDFFGFPEELYQIEYPAAGDPALAAEIGRLLSRHQVAHRLNRSRGLDHGAWVVLRLMYPDATIPVVAMSVNPRLSPAEQYRIGQALAPLRRQNVLILASGGSVHNFKTMRWWDESQQGDRWAEAFDQWVSDRARAWDLEALFAYRTRAPHADLAVPLPGVEHFIPFFYAMGAADDQRVCRERFRSYRYGNLSHTVWQFGEAA
ncbi:MAG TPA: class III extradiol ring-cleavage dioxygenase [Symbiobacteriaceae bacterium]